MLGVLAAAVAVAAVDIAVLVVTRDARPAATSTHRAKPGAADVVAVIDPTTSRVVDRVNVGRTPTIVAAGYGGAWVLNKDDGTLSHLVSALGAVFVMISAQFGHLATAL